MRMNVGMYNIIFAKRGQNTQGLRQKTRHKGDEKKKQKQDKGGGGGGKESIG